MLNKKVAKITKKAEEAGVVLSTPTQDTEIGSSSRRDRTPLYREEEDASSPL